MPPNGSTYFYDVKPAGSSTVYRCVNTMKALSSGNDISQLQTEAS